ncbi:MAG: dienelactone hydrolase family protein [Labilithrix sp.]|nr:dienelactone hydrolase family protein [Labilithrix sp.]MCW5811275.1 dienelactone hydrolase family protein [Labilithrix sp.]
MNRRAFLSAGAALALGACKKKEPAVKRTVEHSSHATVDFLELVHPEPDPSLPLVVAIHANGGAPEHWVEGFSKFPGRARILLPRGYRRKNEGYEWFEWPLTNDLASTKLAMDVSLAEERLAKAIAARVGQGGRVAVTGYTEGAILAFVLAKRKELVLGAFGIAGACPVPLYPKSNAAPIVAYHGTKDDVFAINAARATVAAYKTAGGEATLREYAEGHSPSDKMHEDLDADIVKALEAARSPSR